MQRMSASSAAPEFLFSLADPEKMMFSGTKPAARARELAARDHVGAGDEPGERARARPGWSSLSGRSIPGPFSPAKASLNTR